MHRTQILDDKGFWLDLEFTLSGHFYDAESPEMRGHWVDGFVLLEAKNTKFGVVVHGQVWMGPQEWGFQLSVPQNLLHKPITSYAFTVEQFDPHAKFLGVAISKPKI